MMVVGYHGWHCIQGQTNYLEDLHFLSLKICYFNRYISFKSTSFFSFSFLFVLFMRKWNQPMLAFASFFSSSSYMFREKKIVGAHRCIYIHTWRKEPAVYMYIYIQDRKVKIREWWGRFVSAMFSTLTMDISANWIEFCMINQL